MKRLWGEICRHHRYIVLFTSIDGRSEGTRILTAIQLLTVQSMLMFILALCYDLQSPQDDGTCQRILTKEECQSSNSVFDSTSRCRWVHGGDGEEAHCQYLAQKNESLSVETIVIISAIVAAFTAPINLLVDFLFLEILSAPSADITKLGEEESTLVKTVRRASLIGAKIGNQVHQRGRELLSTAQQRKSMFRDVRRLRQIPVTASAAHQVALENAHLVLDVARNEHEQYVNRRKTLREQHSAQSKTADGQPNKKHRPLAPRSGQDLPVSLPSQVNNEDLPLDDWFDEFRVDLQQQRLSLKTPQLQQSFDEKWGLDPNGYFKSREQAASSWFGRPTVVSSETLMREEIKTVRSQTQSKYEKLRLATDVQIGLELIHLFILDLLGRTTPVARIFLRKTEEDFRHSMIVSRFWKAVAWLIVIVLNLFFVYFSLLRGLQRGVDWQHSYMMACLFQLALEVLFYETSECAIVQFVIPDLARHEVVSANYVIMQAIQQICGSQFQTKGQERGNGGRADPLDAPRYFFVSTNVAQRFPRLLESVIIRAYHTCSPGALTNIWSGTRAPEGPWWSPTSGRHRAKKFFVTSLLVAWLQRLGAFSPTLQRVIIHIIQPIAASGLVLLWFPLQKYPELWAVIGVLVSYLGYLTYQSAREDLQTSHDITPLMDSAPESTERGTQRKGLSEECEKEEIDQDDQWEDDGQWDEDEEGSDDLDETFHRYFNPSQYISEISESDKGESGHSASSPEEKELNLSSVDDSRSHLGSSHNDSDSSSHDLRQWFCQRESDNSDSEPSDDRRQDREYVRPPVCVEGKNGFVR
jgi:hypothetical protein